MTDVNAVRERLEGLRGHMNDAGLYAYYIPTTDAGSSEREFFSGFTGSAGDLLITPEEALLWTDGRYFIQAERELEGTGIILMRSGEEGVETLEEYIKRSFPEEAVLGFYGRDVKAVRAKKLKKALPSHKVCYKKDLSAGIYQRPLLPWQDTEVIGGDLSGESSVDRIAKLRSELASRGLDAVFITDPTETAYLFNIRAWENAYTPAVMSYSYITSQKAYIFLKNEKADTGYAGSIVKSVDEICDFLGSSAVKGRILVDEASADYWCYKLIKKRGKAVSGISPVQLMKAVKNETELSHIRDIYHRDSLQLTRFIRWMDTDGSSKSEMSAADKLLDFRKSIPEFKGLSFPTIAAYGDNAAIIHYEPSAEHDRPVEARGLFMVDSGGQYKGGTTDVTRTLVMGELTEEEKEAFTLTACGMLRIRYAHFIKGTTGVNLDMLARERMWKRGIDYKHGTGHGLGYMLGVHEGPQSIRWKYLDTPCELKPGMLISDEPGVYKKDRFGVRTENILLVEEDVKTEDGVFYRFANLTQVPIDDRGMDKSMMSSEELEMYERYQQEIIEALSPDMDEEEKKWLREYCGVRG